jgi:GTPase SAR1 family protein
MRVSWISKADWFIIVFDLTDKQTLTQDAADWFTEISNLKSREERNVLLVGNKGDLNIDIEVTGLEALEWAEERGIEYLEVSAKSYDSVVKAFNKVLKLDRAKNTEKEQEFSIVVCGGGETGKSAISVQFYRGVSSNTVPNI